MNWSDGSATARNATSSGTPTRRRRLQPPMWRDCEMEQPESYQMLTEQERSHAQERFAVIHPFLEKRASLADLADQHHISVRTLRRWVRAYEQQGLPGLIRKARSDQGVAQRITPELQHMIEGLALQKPPPTAASISSPGVRHCPPTWLASAELSECCPPDPTPEPGIGHPGAAWIKGL